MILPHTPVILSAMAKNKFLFPDEMSSLFCSIWKSEDGAAVNIKSSFAAINSFLLCNNHDVPIDCTLCFFLLHIWERVLIPKRTSCVGLFKVRSKHLLEYPNISPQFPPPCLGELGGRGVGGLAHRSPLHTLWPVDDGKTSYKAREMTPLLPQRRES